MILKWYQFIFSILCLAFKNWRFCLGCRR